MVLIFRLRVYLTVCLFHILCLISVIIIIIIIVIIIRYGFLSVVRYANNGHVNTTFDDVIHFVFINDVINGGDRWRQQCDVTASYVINSWAHNMRVIIFIVFLYVLFYLLTIVSMFWLCTFEAPYAINYFKVSFKLRFLKHSFHLDVV